MRNQYTNKIEFFHECYKLESQRKYFWNIYAEAAEHRHKTKVAYNAEPSGFNVSSKKLQQLAKLSQFYERDKAVYFCRYFIVTKHEQTTFGKESERLVCCPILYYPVSFVGDKWDALSRFVPDYESPQINPAAIEVLKSLIPEMTPELKEILDSKESFYDAVMEQVDSLRMVKTKDNGKQSNRQYKYSKQSSLVPRLNAALKQSDIELFAIDMISERLVKSFVDEHPDDLFLSWESWLCLCDKLEGSESVLFELDKMRQSYSTSSPLSRVLSLEDKAEKSENIGKLFRGSTKPYHVPAILSDQQQQALDASCTEKLSLVLGPPGTGKSYTIACMALAAYMRGESVLILSQNHHAVNVVRNKMIREFGIDKSLTVVGSKSGASSDLAKELATPITDKVDEESRKQNEILKEIELELEQTLKELDHREKNFRARCDYEAERDIDPDREQHKDQPSGNFLQRIFKRIRGKEVDNNQLKYLTQDLERIEELDKKAHDLIVQKMNTVNKLTKIKAYSFDNKEISTSIDNFRTSLFQHSAKMQNQYNAGVNYEKLLEVLPIWFAPITNLSHLLPLTSELFDLVIIDEASQCNIAVSAPALHRAKKVVVVGDPKQLKHMSFVSKEKQQQLHQDMGLIDSKLSSNYRDNSLIDYVQSVITHGQIIQLNEHYRSHPQIISFSNNHFYNDELHIMTEKPGDQKDAIELIETDGRRTNGTNIVEAARIVEDLRTLINEQKAVPGREAHSVGILSFFSKQTKMLEKMVFDKFTINEIRKHDVRIGTPFNFQGEERDVMFISCCIDENTPLNSYTYLNRDDVFNVSITRARDTQKIYLSCAPQKIKSSTLLKKYIEYCLDYKKNKQFEQNRANTLHDKFQEDVITHLRKLGITCYKNYRIAGKSLDIVAVYDNKCLAIDLVGYLGDLRDVLPLKRFKLLYRAGLPSFLLSYTEWTQDTQVMKEMIMERLDVTGRTAEEEKAFKAAYKKISDQDEDLFKELFDVSLSRIGKKFAHHGKPRGSSQAYLLAKKYKQFISVLDQKFEEKELTNERYQQAFQRLIQQSLSNLEQTLATLDILNSLLEQEREYARLPEEHQYEGMHDERIELIEEQQSHLHALMLENESALHQMDKTTMRLNQLQTTVSGVTDISEAEEMLKEMTERLEKYSSK